MLAVIAECLHSLYLSSVSILRAHVLQHAEPSEQLHAAPSGAEDRKYQYYYQNKTGSFLC